VRAPRAGPRSIIEGRGTVRDQVADEVDRLAASRLRCQQLEALEPVARLRFFRLRSVRPPRKAKNR
jgi:hypothetical protein